MERQSFGTALLIGGLLAVGNLVAVANPVAVSNPGAEADPAAVAVEDPSAWLDDLTFRTYGRPDFDLVRRSGTGLGSALAVGDFNADGRDDLVVGAPHDSPGGTDSGWVGVAYGGSGVFPNDVEDLPGDQAAGQWGAEFAVGDFNADGIQDLAIGVPRRDFGAVQDSGSVWLLDGSPAGVGGLSRPIRDVGQSNALDGFALAVGDFNADGVDDLAIGTPNMTLQGQDAGQVTVRPGRQGAGPVSDGEMVIDRLHEEVEGDPVSGEALGSAMAAGDFDGDGYDDLAIGVPGATVDGTPGAGSVLVIYAGEDAETGDIVPYRVEEINRATEGVPGDPTRNEAFGAGLAVGNVDGDFFADLLVGAPGADVEGIRLAGEVVQALGNAGGLDWTAAPPIHMGAGGLTGNPATNDNFGRVLTVADLDGDGTDDLLIGVPERNRGPVADAGHVAVVFGTDNGLDPALAVSVEAGVGFLGAPANNRQQLGTAFAVGDWNGDGITDVAIGAPGQDLTGEAQAGAVVIGWGPADPLIGVPTATPPPATATATATPTVTPRATNTPRPTFSFYLPYATRLGFLGRYPAPPAGAGGSAGDGIGPASPDLGRSPGARR